MWRFSNENTLRGGPTQQTRTNWSALERAVIEGRRWTVRSRLKVVTRSGWFAAHPSGTETVYEIYAESFRDQPHLDALVNEAQRIVDNALL